MTYIESGFSCLAIIPARGGSKGLPGKNILPLLGKPLISYSIEAALQSGCADEVIVSTDSKEIAETARKSGASVPFERPNELASDEAKTIDVLKHALSNCELKFGRRFDHILLLQPTSPLRDAEDIRNAYAQFVHSDADSLQSVVLAQIHPYLLRLLDSKGTLFDYKEVNSHVRRQDLEDFYQLNGAIYLMKRDLLMKSDQIVGEKNQGFVMPREKSIDIDDFLDFQIAECFMKEQRKSE